MEESKTMEQEPVTQEEEIVVENTKAEDVSETADQEEAQAEPETAEEDAGTDKKGFFGKKKEKKDKKDEQIAELTDKLVETATTIIDAEKKAREQVRSQNEPALRDRIYRAAGTMKSAYLIDTSEAVQCISDVLIGLQMGFLSGMDAQKLYTLEEHIRPAMLTGAPQDRDRKRAEMLREATAGIRFA